MGAKKTKARVDIYRVAYLMQNHAIHSARTKLGLSLDQVRGMAEALSGARSISQLTLEARHELIDRLIKAGARHVNNPQLPKAEPTLYEKKLAEWERKFPRPRPGFASPAQLAAIEAIWEDRWEDGRSGRHLRGFVFRQTGLDDLVFLRSGHVRQILTALKRRMRREKNGA
jgi:hypothetical protein